ncbi:hypothetical protein ACFU76_12685 [Streptomyces sp. NPDC057539]|uniref:hypothetical protein n=1 Tax=Streptomyces sp. NPDC057539 TaxID=3346159 RepID=UPI0036CC5D91
MTPRTLLDARPDAHLKRTAKSTAKWTAKSTAKSTAKGTAHAHPGDVETIR